MNIDRLEILVIDAAEIEIERGNGHRVDSAALIEKSEAAAFFNAGEDVARKIAAGHKSVSVKLRFAYYKAALIGITRQFVRRGVFERDPDGYLARFEGYFADRYFKTAKFLCLIYGYAAGVQGLRHRFGCVGAG